MLLCEIAPMWSKIVADQRFPIRALYGTQVGAGMDVRAYFYSAQVAYNYMTDIKFPAKAAPARPGEMLY
jgi:hypothetical protein